MCSESALHREVVILGSTGSIGTQALEVVDGQPGAFRVVGLAAGGNRPGLLAEQAVATRAEHVAVADEGRVDDVADAIAVAARGAGAAGYAPRITGGAAAVADLATVPCDVVLNGVDGAVGLDATLATLGAGTPLALANKESLIVGGDLILDAVGGPDKVLDRIIPVDSEHSALAQCLRGGRADEVDRLILTASGGPFRGRTRDDLRDVTVEAALDHPTWSMGGNITLNSATMMNKALEVIEAHLLFGVPYSSIDVTVHAQSIVHSMVQFCDGSTLAQCSPPDMRLPIALGLSWPRRMPRVGPPCDWTTAQTWTFEPVDTETFPATRLARDVGEAGGTFPAVFNAANEQCLAEFRSGGLPFLGIVDTVEAVVERHAGHDDARRSGEGTLTVDAVRSADAWARNCAREIVAGR